MIGGPLREPLRFNDTKSSGRDDIDLEQDLEELKKGEKGEDAHYLRNVVKVGGIIRWTFARDRGSFKPYVYYGVDPSNLSTY